MTTAKRAIVQYRELDKSAKSKFDPSGKPGAERVRELQKLARCLAAAKNKNYLPLLFRTAEYKMPQLARESQIMQLIQLGEHDANIATREAHAAHPRRSNWDSPIPSLKSCLAGDTIDVAFKYRGKHKGRTGYIYHPVMQSAARISNDGMILSALIGYAGAVTTCIVQAGRGYKWDIDSNGVRLVRLVDGDDYHPSSDDIRAGRAAIITALRERADTRKKFAAAAKRDAKIIAAACADGVWVSLADAVSAGNCRTGIENFARRHNLDIRRHYHIDSLPREHGDTSRRVALAVLAAQRRQARDLVRGYSEL